MTSTDVLENKHGAENMRTAIIASKEDLQKASVYEAPKRV